MLDRVMADLIVVFHLLFIVFAVGGGLLVIRWPRLIWLHAPAVTWAVLVEVNSWQCPLTRWENLFRERYGADGYEGGFIDQYLLAIIYPDGLTDRIQLAIGIFVFTVNFIVYGFIHQRYLHRRRKARRLAVEAEPAPTTPVGAAGV